VSGLAALAAYLVGAIPVGYLVGRAFGVADIRLHGSGNIGATNVLRAAGRGAAVLTLVLDVVKGGGAVLLASALAGAGGRAAAAAAVAAVVGNCWSVYLRFRGGKGVATGLGALLALVPWAVLPALPVFAVAVAATRFVSLGSMTAALCVPAAAALLGYPRPAVVGAAAIAAVVVLRHRDNIARLRAGTERRLGGRAAAEAVPP
jgi:glycerol-3-phosphate acyltransferase PlsY